MLSSYGYLVVDISTTKNLCDAIAVSPNGRAYFIEFKSKRSAKLTDGEKKFAEILKNHGFELKIMVDEQDVTDLIVNDFDIFTVTQN